MYTGPLLTPPSLCILSFFVSLCRQNKNTDYFSQLGECRTKAHSCCINQSPVWISLKTAGLHICRVLLRRRAYCEHRSFYVVSVDASCFIMISNRTVSHAHPFSQLLCIIRQQHTVCKCVISTNFQGKSSILVSQMYSVSFACSNDHFHSSRFSNKFIWFIFTWVSAGLIKS